MWWFQKGFDPIVHSAVVAARGLRNLDDRFDEWAWEFYSLARKQFSFKVRLVSDLIGWHKRANFWIKWKSVLTFWWNFSDQIRKHQCLANRIKNKFKSIFKSLDHQFEQFHTILEQFNLNKFRPINVEQNCFQ